MTHICVGNLTIIGSDNGLSPGRRQAIIWTNAGILLIGPWGTNVSEILIGIQTFSFKKMHVKMSSAKWRLFRFGLNVLNGGLVKVPLEHERVITSHTNDGCDFWISINRCCIITTLLAGVAFMRHLLITLLWCCQWITLTLYSLSVKTPFCQISLSLEAARSDDVIIVPLWNLTSNWKRLNPILAASRFAVRRLTA